MDQKTLARRPQARDFDATGAWDIVTMDFGGIADRMGC